jgi:cardiolipin synthase (CMP-forming)
VASPLSSGPVDAAPAASGDRVLTVPNLLSVARLLCVPLFLWLLFGAEERYAAAWLLAVLGCTDWVDGYIARRFSQVSSVGKVLDPTADRLLLGVGIVGILIDGSVPAWIAWLAIAREALIAIGTVTLLALGGRRIDVQLAGKAGTFLLMMAFPLFLISNDPDFAWREAAEGLAWACAVVGLFFAWYSAIRYIPLARTALREEQEAKNDRARVGGSGEPEE